MVERKVLVTTCATHLLTRLAPRTNLETGWARHVPQLVLYRDETLVGHF